MTGMRTPRVGAGRPRRHRSVPTPRRRPLVAALAVVGVTAVVGGVAWSAGRGHGGGSPVRARAVFEVGREARPPGGEVVWWAPVRGEPLGVAVGDDDVAITALDEVRVVDAADGTVRWVAAFPGVRTHRPAVGADRVAATSESVLALFRRTDGALVAAVPFEGPGPAAVLTAGDGGAVVVAASESGAMLAVDATTGVVRWSAEFPGEVLVAPQADAGVVVASWNDDAGATLRAFDLLDGRPRWQARTGAFSGAPLVVAGTVVVADGPSPRAGRVRALDVRTGEVRWETPLAGWFDPYLEAAADPSTAYLVDGVGTVVALDLTTGTVRWREETGFDVLHRGVAITASTVVFPTFDGALVVLDRPTGRPRSADPAPGVPIDVVGAGDRLLVALRLGAPSRVEARSGP